MKCKTHKYLSYLGDSIKTKKSSFLIESLYTVTYICRDLMMSLFSGNFVVIHRKLGLAIVSK